ncbi:MAG: hypothetical protein IIA02_14140 [Proteobacteria bacterium]|uniref:hypothetical protein n=1 Tax=Aquabacterium sp. TaxID=1872578 RepID=UPI0035C6C37C|nr:hypothetical protein [Pseudomonadota bacterium]
MNKRVIAVLFSIGLLAVAWVAWGFVGSSWTALAMSALIAVVYLLGAHELRLFRSATEALRTALNDIPQPLAGPDELGAWLQRLPESLHNPVRLRIEGERAALPGPALTPYLVGLLVMLGMLGTFLGMVVTFKGAVFALEGAADLATIRGALAEPIKGLGMSFGTSVAGVAASAMLGLISALSRRERVEAMRLLDGRIATVFKPFTPGHQRQATFQALQVQAQAMPQVVDRLQALAEGLERRSEQLAQQLGERLQAQQQQFHHEVSLAYTALAGAVSQSLRDSLVASARTASDTLRPVVEQAMAGIAQAAQLSHQRLIDTTQAQLDGLGTRWQSMAQETSQAWTQAQQAQGEAHAKLLAGLDRALSAFQHSLGQGAGALLDAQGQALSQAQAAQAQADAQRLEGWTRLLADSEALVRSRMDSETRWQQAQGERMAQLAELWRQELGALHAQQAEQGQAAIARLDALQATAARHLADLGATLEAPMGRLLQTAAEVPQAASELIAQLRREMGQIGERDNALLSERTAMMAQLGSLLSGLEHSAGQQRAATEALVASATEVLSQAGGRFAQALDAQAHQVDAAVAPLATHMAASAVELASLGEAFGRGVDLFSASNERLVESLQGIEAALGQSMARSDEQLAYYVAQAREVIDLSIASQQGIVEDLRRLHGKAKEGATP